MIDRKALICRSCGQIVAAADALVVEWVRSGEQFVVHRPSLDTFCFRDAVGSVLVHRLLGVVADDPPRRA